MARDWTKYKNEIRKLYLVEHKPLEEVRRLVKGKFGFQASPRAYRSKLVEWGYRRSDTSGQDLTGEPPQPLSSFASPTSFRPAPELSLQASTAINSATVMPTDSATNNYSSVDFDIHSPSAFQVTAGNWPPNQVSNTPNQAYFELPSASERPAQNRSLRSPLDEQDDQGRTRLHHAVINGVVDDIRTLLYSGASVDVRDNVNDQPLHLALRQTSDQAPIAQLLIDFGASPDTPGKNGKTPLHLSLTSTDTLKILLRAHPELAASDLLGNTALHDAAFNIDRTSNSFIELLTHGANVNAVNAAGESPFHMILERADKMKQSDKTVLSSLQHGADIHMRNRRNQLPLEILTEKLQSKLVARGWSENCWFEETELFAAKGASLDIKLASGDCLFSFLVKNGAFHFYVYGGRCRYDSYRNKKMCVLFCERVDPHTRGLGGNTALHDLLDYWPVSVGEDALKALLKRGSDANAGNDAGCTPLDLLFKGEVSWPVKNISPKVLQLLAQAGANPFHKSVSGDLVLYTAARCLSAKSRAAALQALLAGTTTAMEEAGRPEATTRDKEWPQTFMASLRQAKNGNWPGADARLLRGESYLPTDVRERISTVARVVLAESTLMHYQTAISEKRDDESLSHIELTSIRAQVIAILRGCRTNRIEIDQTLYQVLLDVVD